MQTKYDYKLVKISIICGLLFPILSLFMDIGIIKEDFPQNYENINIFLASRILPIIINLVFAYQIFFKRKITNYQVPIIYLGLLISSIVGHWFLPAYYLSFIQVMVACSLFFPFPKKYYYITSGLSFAAMLSVIFFSTAHYSSDPEMQNIFKMDAFFGVLIVFILSISGYKFVTLTREKKDIESQKFLEVGKNISSVVHEIKGLMSGPRVYFKILNRELEKGNVSEHMKQAISNLERDYQSLLDYVQAVNKLTINDNSLKDINVRENVENILKTLFATHSKTHNISLVGDAYIHASSDIIKRSIVNLVNNSLENFSLKSINRGNVIIELKGDTVRIKDNGGGYTPEALKKVNKNESFTTKASGTGLGLYMIKNDLASVGGKVKIYNEEDGAVVEIKFKPAIGGMNG